MTDKCSTNKSCMEKFFEVLDQIVYEELAPEVIDKAAACVADYTSVFISGTTVEKSTMILNGLGGDIERLSSEDLALWLGSTARLLDMDDGHRFAMGHPGVPVLTGAFAALRESDVVADGKRFLLAIIKGYEIYCYLGRSINPSAYLGRGFDSTSVCGAAAATVAAGTVMGLDNAALLNAVTISCSLCGGMTHSFEDGSSPKYLCAGWGPKLALTSIKMARAGLHGPVEILEGKNGYTHALSPEPNMDYLNNPKLVLEVLQVYFKRWACVRRIHAALDVVDQLVQDNNIGREVIEKIKVYGGKFLMGVLKYNPPHLVAAQTSLPYSVAVYLVHDKVTMELLDENLHNQEVLDLMNKITIEESEELNLLMADEPSLWGAAKVEIFTKDGQKYTGEARVARGDPEMPFSDKTMEDKFFALVKDVIPPSKAQHLWGKLKDFKNIQDVGNQFLNNMLT